MNYSNLPPGVSVNDIPGCGPDDDDDLLWRIVLRNEEGFVAGTVDGFCSEDAADFYASVQEQLFHPFTVSYEPYKEAPTAKNDGAQGQ